MELLTPEEAAKRLKCTPRAIQDMLRSGRLTGIKVGKYWRLRESDLEQFIMANSTDKARAKD